jgi:Tol biopolymer transport system component/predicted Ser/Thr protein kinase
LFVVFARETPVSNLSAMLEADQQIGRYRISAAIGAGGMGEVYLAKDEELERSVALKILPSDISDDAERVQRFIQEAKVVSALNHPNILTIHEIGFENGMRFIASEYVDGRTLRTIIRGDELELKEVLEIAIQVASALETAHRKNIVHRDIKPENVMVREDGLVKVLDFGLAKLLKADGEAIDTEAATKAKVMTQFGMILGTVNYMSPEQTRGVAAIDGRTDIWSLGVLIFEMLARRLPFEGESPTDIMASILKSETPRLSDFYEDCPPELERIIQKSLQKNRDERYQVVRDMALDLKSLGKELDSSAQLFRSTGAFNRSSTSEYERSQVDTESQINDTAARPASRHPVFAFVSAAMAIGLLAVLGIWYFAPFGRIPEQSSPASALKTVEVVIWASTPGEIYSVGSFSPDAKMIAFSSTKAGTKNIWIKQTTSGEAIQITKDEFMNEQPIWSPNGEELAFYSTRGNQGAFWRIPILGGSPKLISTTNDGGSRLRFWSKDNQIYYESKGELSVTDVNSGQTKLFTDLASKGIKGTSFSLSPDEKIFAYKTVEGETWNLWATTVADKTPKQLLSSPTEIKNVAWHPDNKRIFYSVVTDGTFQIFVTDIYSTTPRQLTFSEQDSLVLDVSSDGTKILYGSAKEESDVWGVNLKDNKEFIVASDQDSELWPEVSPDGKTLAYQSIKNLSQGNKLFSGQILTKNLGTDEQPAELVKNGGLPKWSPDGKTLAFVRITGDKFQIETTKTLDGEKKQLTTEGVTAGSYSVLPYSRLQTSDFSWSPDSTKIVYASWRSGQNNFWIVNADGSNEVQLSENTDSKVSVYCPLWSSDGKRIAFSTRVSNIDGTSAYSVQIIDTETKKTDLITSGDEFLRLIGWSQSGNELILASVKGSSSYVSPTEVSLLNAEIATGKIRQVALLKDAYLYNIRISPDKKAFAFASHREGKDNIWLVPATGGEAKRITNNNDSRLYFSSMAWSPDSSSIFFGKQLRYSMLSMLTNFQ